MNTEITARYELAQQITREAGQLTLQYFQQPSVEVVRKSDDSPVTVADREAEQLLRQRVAEHFPNDAIIGEEFGRQEGTTGYCWVFDPIDGTKSFISGVPLYGSMTGILHNDLPVAGVVYVPGLDEGVHAALGAGAWSFVGDSAPTPAKVSTRSTLSEGAFVTSQFDTFGERGAADALRAMEEAAYISRTWGDCYGYLLVATGRAEVMIDPIMSIWDAAAVLPILQEAGGMFTDWSGNATIHTGEGVGSNGLVHAEVLAILQSGERGA